MIYRRVFDSPFTGWSSPFSELERMRRQMDNLMQGISGDVARSVPAGVFPLVNLSEDTENYYVRAELPGVKGDDLDIKADGRSISLSGERKIEIEGNGVKYHRREREAGKFARMVSLPGEIDPEKVSASLKDGLLKVVVPKAEAVKPRAIKVQ